ncbi:MAG: LptF/LptG family permease [Planctomycetia bacterium]|nr:LptF/LptG family permease [Planctomycetia bacterium]
MKIIDRYIILNFVRNLLLWYLTLMGLYIIVDLFSNIDSFFNAENNANPFVIMFRYYFFHLFPIIDMISASTILVSALTVMSMMIKRNEMIALMSLGISRIRVISPILIVTILYIILLFFLKEMVLPHYKVEFVKTPKEIALSQSGIQVKRYQDADSKVWLDGKQLFLEDQKINEPILTFPIDFHIPQNVIQAEEAIYIPQTENKPSGYLLKNVNKIKELIESKTLSTKDKKGREFIFLPNQSSPELGPNDCFIASGISLEFLATGEEWINYASLGDLISAFKNPSFRLSRKKIETQIHARIINPLACLIPLILGLPIIFLRSDRNMIQSIALGALLSALFLGVQFVCIFLGAKLDSPIFAAWFPLILFVPIATTTFASLVD